MSQSNDTPRDGLRDGLRDAPRDLPHTTPHHTTPSKSPTSSRNDAQRGGRANDRILTARLAEISWLDAMTIAVVTIRPDWAPLAVRGVLARTKGSRTELATAALRAACDPDVRGPGAIENFDDRKWVTRAQTYPTVREALNPELCDEHGGVAGACALCRAGVGA